MLDPSGRRHNRNVTELKAKVGGKGFGIMPAIIKNVSLSGMYFETLAKFEVQNRILLESHVEHSGKARRLLIECEIMHCTLTETPQTYGYGARFTKLGRDNLSILLPLVADLWVKEKPLPIVA
jgi:hypothetical protein